MCTKRKHASTYGAARAILELFRAKRAYGRRMGIYYCGECDAYHITSRGSNRCIAVLNKNF